LKLQKTIQSECKINGRGLFGGQEAKVTFRPAPVDTGLTFIRIDVPEPVRISALATNLAERSRRTTIKNGSVSIETVEHCLAAVMPLKLTI
jgi:UDP-3-O-acyl-N-acetylglucosamine deacetylase